MTAIEFFAWGLIDPLTSLFVENIAKNYFLVGLAFGLRALSSTLTVFFTSRVLKNISASQGFFIGLLGLSFSGICFFSAGYWNSLFLLFLGFFIQGISSTVKEISKIEFLSTYINSENVSGILGTNAGFKYSFWSGGMFLGAIFFFALGDSAKNYGEYFPFFYLVFGIFCAGVSLVLLKFRNQFHSLCFQKIWEDIKTVIFDDHVVVRLLKTMKKFPVLLNFSLLIFCLLEIISKAVVMFVPLLGIALGLSLPQVLLLTALMIAPLIFTFLFSKLADKYDRMWMVAGGLFLSFFPMILLANTNAPLFIGILSSITSLAIAMIQPAIMGITASLTPPEYKEETMGLELFFGNIGKIIGGSVLGAIAQSFGIQFAFLVIALFTILFFFIALGIKWHITEHLYKKIREEKTHTRHLFEHIHFHAFRHFR